MNKLAQRTLTTVSEKSRGKASFLAEPFNEPYASAVYRTLTD